MKKIRVLVYIILFLFPTSVFATNKDIIKKIEKDEKTSSELIIDGTIDDNIRYVGANPNNYIKFNGELWRIIGVMNNVKTSEGENASRVKIVREDSLGKYSWDKTITGVNSGQGINEWTNSYLKDLLNTSGYWDRTSTTCGNGVNGATTTCDFTTTGLTEEAKEFIDTVVWDTGSNWDNNYKEAKGNDFYNFTKSGKGGNYCTSGIFCNDTVERTTSWTGKVGLINSADYIMATDGGDPEVREKCLNDVIIKDWDDNNPECYNNDWLTTTTEMWTISPYTDATYNTTLFYTRNKLGMRAAYYTYGIRPSLYLIPNLMIIKGDGSRDNPYEVIPYEEEALTLTTSDIINLSDLWKESFDLDGIDFSNLQIDNEAIIIETNDDLEALKSGYTEMLIQINGKAYVMRVQVNDKVTNPNTKSNILVVIMTCISIILFIGIYRLTLHSRNETL